MGGLTEFAQPVGQGGTAAVLREIDALLEQLVATGTTGTIDLGSLPLSPDERDLLERTLGRGEVEATVVAFGPSRVRETAIGGVWWVEHRDENDRVVTEFIEVTYIPAILPAQQGDARDGLALLRSRLQEEDTPQR